MKKKYRYPDISVSGCGLFVKSNAPYLGASPDGIVTYTNSGKTETGVLEVKCPAAEKWKALSPEECAKDVDYYCDLETGLCQLKQSHKYYFQLIRMLLYIVTK